MEEALGLVEEIDSLLGKDPSKLTVNQLLGALQRAKGVVLHSYSLPSSSAHNSNPSKANTLKRKAETALTTSRPAKKKVIPGKTQENNSKKITTTQKANWSFLPAELLVAMMRYLPPLVQKKSFQLVCKTWKACYRMNLTKIAGLMINANQLVAERYKWLADNFPSLKEIRHVCPDTTMLFSTDKLLPFLPHSLRKINLSRELTNEGVKHLPAGLRTLHAYKSMLVDDTLKELPKSLTFLDLGGTHGITNEGLKFLPQSLKHLSLVNCSGLSTGALKCVPRSLRHLTINSSVVTDEDVKCLPKSLKGLVLYGDVTLTDEGLRNLPRSLHALQAQHCPNITDKGLGFLPPLTQLQIGSRNITDFGLKLLPRTLRNLVLHGVNYEMITQQGLKNLPESLEDLDVPGEVIYSESLKYLPRSLTRLVTSVCDNLTDEGLANLPPGILELDISLCDEITDHGLTLLPRSLKYLNLFGCSGITDSGVKRLPEGLQTFLTFSQITDEGLSNLPPNLKTLEVMDANGVTDKGFMSLPKSLVTIRLYNCPWVTGDVLLHLPLQVECVEFFDCCNVNPQASMLDFKHLTSLKSFSVW